MKTKISIFFVTAIISSFIGISYFSDYAYSEDTTSATGAQNESDYENETNNIVIISPIQALKKCYKSIASTSLQIDEVADNSEGRLSCLVTLEADDSLLPDGTGMFVLIQVMATSDYTEIEVEYPFSEEFISHGTIPNCDLWSHPDRMVQCLDCDEGSINILDVEIHAHPTGDCSIGGRATGQINVTVVARREIAKGFPKFITNLKCSSQ